LSYNATDGVVIGYSRYYGRVYSDFSSTPTNEKYIAYSGSNAAANDPFVCIGRFAATLSSPTGVWTVPIFTASNLVQGWTDETRMLTAVPSPDWNGTDPTTPTTTYFYRIKGKKYEFYFRQSNTGAGSSNTRVQFNALFTGDSTYTVSSQANYAFSGFVSTADFGSAPTTAVLGAYLYGNTIVVMDFSSIAAKTAMISGSYYI